MGIFIYQLNVGDLYIIVNVCEGKVTVAGSAVSGSYQRRHTVGYLETQGLQELQDF